MTRSALFSVLRRALCQAPSRFPDDPHSAPLQVRPGLSSGDGMGRRRFLLATAKGATILSAGLALKGCFSPRNRGVLPRIAIVGGGLAGLNCAYHLKKEGIPATVYEAGSRLGGRIHTEHDLVGAGLSSELGGEFIDSNHSDLLHLAREFGIGLVDRESVPERENRNAAYFFEGRHRTEEEVIQEVRPLLRQVAVDRRKAGSTIDFENTVRAAPFDRLSISEYLDRIGAGGWIRRYLEVAYTAEFGLDPGDQSALNLITLISTSASGNRFEIYGDSDERYLIEGGSQRITDALAASLEGQPQLHHRLVRIQEHGSGFRLAFDGPRGIAVEENVDIAVVCIPFSVLRDVALELPLPPHKKKAIAELGYGTNARLVAGLARRLRNGRGGGGEMYSDEPFQQAWESLPQPAARESAINFVLAGRGGMDLGSGTPQDQLTRLMEGFEKGWSGTRTALNGRVARAHWPTDPLARGSYPCYKPGQWTTLGGTEGSPVGNLLFAGDHCDLDFQGYMNGAAYTGRLAAKEILSRV
jgi:monoamine oxidase